MEEIHTSLQTTPAPMVERAFRLLDVLSESEDGLTLSDLARVLGMSKGSMHGLLKTLENSGVIELSEDRRYTLGPHVYDLAQSYVQRAGLRRFALPTMRRLAADTGETVLLGRVESECTRVIECVRDESESPGMHIAARRGTRVHLLAAATGPLILASWPCSQREAFLSTHDLPRFTERSITDPERYLAAVEAAARARVSMDREQYLAGVNAVAVPIYGPGTSLAALLWIVGFASHFDEKAMQNAARQMRAEAEQISQALGAPQPVS
jgi:IclR family acetate operon transcriptional repressor